MPNSASASTLPAGARLIGAKALTTPAKFV